MASKKRKWFQKGAFEDGYQFGDIFKTMRATGRDVATNLYAGAAGIAEKAIDAGAYIAGGVGGLFGADKFKDKTAEFITKDIIDEEKVGGVIGDIVGSIGTNALIDRAVLGKDYREKYDNYSVLGEKSDSLANSAGQLGAQIGLQAVGVPWWVTTGVTSFGSGVEEALNDGTSYGKAGLSSIITAGADILTEKLFGGSGFGEKGLINVEPLTKWISNKAIKTFADYGVDMLAEGSEEVFSEFMGNLGSSVYKKGKLKDILFSKEAAEGYLESFIGGVVLSGFANGGKASESITERTDYRSGFTENEQKVFDRMYSEVAIETKAENSGNRLTRKQKAEIYDNALQQVKNGQVDTQTIEAALGGEEYSTYKNALNNYEVLQQELNEIQARDNKVKTQEQATREIEIKNELERIKTKANKLKNILQNKVAEKIDIDNIHLKTRESYLWDSYIRGLSKLTNNTLNDVKTNKGIDEDAFVDGLWEDSPNSLKDNVENSQLESVENVVPLDNNSENGIIKAGGKITDINYLDVGKYELQAERYYAERINDPSDIVIISQNTAFSVEEISKIKTHMMIEKIRFKDGSIRKFDPDIDQALAWKRLIEGNAKETDILLLNHELEELKIIDEKNLAYEDAHQMANKKYNWENAIQNIFDEDELYKGDFE